jgi:hypothetical protein
MNYNTQNLRYAEQYSNLEETGNITTSAAGMNYNQGMTFIIFQNGLL